MYNVQRRRHSHPPHSADLIREMSSISLTLELLYPICTVQHFSSFNTPLPTPQFADLHRNLAHTSLCGLRGFTPCLRFDTSIDIHLVTSSPGPGLAHHSAAHVSNPCWATLITPTQLELQAHFDLGFPTDWTAQALRRTHRIRSGQPSQPANEHAQRSQPYPLPPFHSMNGSMARNAQVLDAWRLMMVGELKNRVILPSAGTRHPLGVRQSRKN